MTEEELRRMMAEEDDTYYPGVEITPITQRELERIIFSVWTEDDDFSSINKLKYRDFHNENGEPLEFIKGVRKGESSVEVDLSEIKLIGSNLKGVNLRKAVLNRANLAGANLEEAHLGGIKLVGANLEEANLERAQLLMANLEGANLEGANLTDVLLESAGLMGVNLRMANLTRAKVSGLLMKANLASANLIEANLSSSNLEGANLAGANLEKANLNSANLRNIELTGAIINDMNVQGAVFSGKTMDIPTINILRKAGAKPSENLIEFSIVGCNYLRGMVNCSLNLEFNLVDLPSENREQLVTELGNLQNYFMLEVSCIVDVHYTTENISLSISFTQVQHFYLIFLGAFQYFQKITDILGVNIQSRVENIIMFCSEAYLEVKKIDPSNTAQIKAFLESATGQDLTLPSEIEIKTKLANMEYGEKVFDMFKCKVALLAKKVRPNSSLKAIYYHLLSMPKKEVSELEIDFLEILKDDKE